MISNKNTHAKFYRLRRQAEKFLAENEKSRREPFSDDPLTLLHELETLQIELEIQNEELRVSQQELIRSRDRYTELYDLAPVGYITIDKTGLIQEVNLTFADMLSIEKKDLINQALSTHIVFKDQDIYYHHLRDLTHSKTRQVCELRIKKKDGIPFDAQLESIAVSGEKNQFRTVITDISNRKAAQKEKEKLESALHQAIKMETIGNLSEGIAHDFNAILYMIMGKAELALGYISRLNLAYTNVEEIQKASLKAAGIIKQLVNFSRKAAQDLKPVNAVLIIEELVKVLGETAPVTIKIQKHFPDEAMTIFGDRIQINQALINLCTNAIQAMELSGGVLDIRVENIALDRKTAKGYSGLPEGDYLKITVSDTGPGIPAKMINEIFDPYFTTRKKKKGMGLTVVYGIVKNHNGIVSVRSEPGKGTVFTLLFPAADGKPEIETETENKFPNGTETILFIGKKASVLDVTQKILEQLGYKVTTSLNPVEALYLFRSRPDKFDLVVTDMTMPQMTGVKLSQKINQVRANIPVIVCTEYYSLMDEEKARLFGIAGYITKPVSMLKLATTIRQVLDR